MAAALLLYLFNGGCLVVAAKPEPLVQPRRIDGPWGVNNGRNHGEARHRTFPGTPPA